MGQAEGVVSSVPDTQPAWFQTLSGPPNPAARDHRRDLTHRDGHFADTPGFRSARLRNLSRDGASCPGLDADLLRIDGKVHLRRGVQPTGRANLLGARIGGSPRCAAGPSLAGEPAIVADRIGARAAVFMRNGFEARGAVRLHSAIIGSALDLSAVNPDNPGQQALNADSIAVGGSVCSGNTDQSNGEIRFIGAEPTGDLGFRNAQAFCPPEYIDDARDRAPGGFAASASSPEIRAIDCASAQIGRHCIVIGSAFYGVADLR